MNRIKWISTDTSLPALLDEFVYEGEDIYIRAYVTSNGEFVVFSSPKRRPTLLEWIFWKRD